MLFSSVPKLDIGFISHATFDKALLRMAHQSQVSRMNECECIAITRTVNDLRWQVLLAWAVNIGVNLGGGQSYEGCWRRMEVGAFCTMRWCPGKYANLTVNMSDQLLYRMEIQLCVQSTELKKPLAKSPGPRDCIMMVGIGFFVGCWFTSR